jgi:DNA polymerase-1
LSGLEVPTDAEMIRYPDRYAEPRGEVMWNRVTEILARREGEEGNEA